jgi:methylmalonyl-CoA mutase
MNGSNPHIRIITATSLFDGHDAAINIMRRILQSKGVEVIHLGHNRSVQEIVEAAIEEDVQAIAITSYQGGHIEFFKYLKDLLEESGCGHIRLFGGGGGTILPAEIKELQDYGIGRIYSPDDGRTLGLEGMIEDLIRRTQKTFDPGEPPEKQFWEAGLHWNTIPPLGEYRDVRRIARSISLAENEFIYPGIKERYLRSAFTGFEKKEVNPMDSPVKTGGGLVSKQEPAEHTRETQRFNTKEAQKGQRRINGSAEPAATKELAEPGSATEVEKDLAAETALREKQRAPAVVSAPVIGITGTGGAGKSSVTDEILRRFLQGFTDKTIAVISVDPSRKKSGGALLGDRIRMNSIHSPRAYMRSLATRESDVALSAHVRDALDICRAAAFDLIILESAGTGQSDASILDHCDLSV